MNPTTPNDPQEPNTPQENFENPITTPPQHNVVETGQQETPVTPVNDIATPQEPAITQTPPAPAPTEPAGPTNDTLSTPTEPSLDVEPNLPPADTAFTAEPQEPTMPASDQTSVPTDPVESAPEQPHNPPSLNSQPGQGTPMPDANIDDKIRQTDEPNVMPAPAQPEKKGNWFTRLFGGGK